MAQDLTLPEETRVANITQQIAELANDNQMLDNEIEDDEEEIIRIQKGAQEEITRIQRQSAEQTAKLRKSIRAKQRKKASNDGLADKMRAKRQIFAVTAAQLRLTDMA